MHIKHSITVILVLLVVVATVQSQKNVKRVNSKHYARASLEKKFNKNVNRNAIKELAKQNVKNEVLKKKTGKKQDGESSRKNTERKGKNVKVALRKEQEGNKHGGSSRKNTEINGKQEKNVKVVAPRKKRKGSNPQLQSRQESICIGSVSVDSSCMTSLKASMKFDRDKITNFKNQLERAENFDKIIGKKVAKNSDFSNSTTYLLIALGSNMSSPNCSGNPSSTAAATETYNTLANCSASVAAACMVPASSAPNFTELAECKTNFEKVETKNDVCLKMKANATAVCDCWSEAASMVVESKALSKSGSCESVSAFTVLKKFKNACLEQFGACKKAEDASVAYIMECTGSSNLSFNSTSTNSTLLL